MSKMKCSLSCLLVALLAVTSYAAERPKVGDKVPEFKMQGSDGKEYAAKDFIDQQAVIIAWFPKAFTGGCTKECKSLKAAGEQLKGFEVAYFTASTDTVEKNAEFAKSLELDYPILCDPEGKNAALFGVLREGGNLAERVTFVIGKNGTILAVIDKVATETHGEDLAKLLAKLGVEKRAGATTSPRPQLQQPKSATVEIID
jgi:thioredoxin-dependent peroxiredoxin